MKKKIVWTMLCLFAALMVSACGEPEKADHAETAKTEASKKTEKSGEDTEKETKADSQDESSGQEQEEEVVDYRLVSVEDVEKYVNLGEYKGLSLESIPVSISDQQVEGQIQSELRQAAKAAGDDAVAEDGDIVNISYAGTIGGEPIEGGSSENEEITIGNGYPIQGFEEGLKGMKKGETKELNVHFDEAYPFEELAGKDAVYQVTLNSIKRVSELDDAWVKEHTEFSTVEEYRKSVMETLEASARQSMESSLGATAISSVIENAEVKEYPAEDLEEAAQEFRSQMEQYAADMDMEFSQLLESQNMTEEDFNTQSVQYAEYCVKRRLVLQGIMDKEGLSFQDKECDAYKEDFAKLYTKASFAEAVETFGEQMAYEYVGNSYVSDFIVKNANFAKEEEGVMMPQEGEVPDESMVPVDGDDEDAQQMEKVE